INGPELGDQSLADIALLRQGDGVWRQGREHSLAMLKGPHRVVVDPMRLKVEADHPTSLLVTPGAPLDVGRAHADEALCDDGPELLFGFFARAGAYRNSLRATEDESSLGKHGLFVALNIALVGSREPNDLLVRLARANQRLNLSRVDPCTC